MKKPRRASRITRKQVRPIDPDEVALRQYMEETVKGLRPDRSTCSYALEFLRTSDANLAQHQKRTKLAILIADCEKLSKWAVDTLTRTAELAKEIKITPLDVKETDVS